MRVSLRIGIGIVLGLTLLLSVLVPAGGVAADPALASSGRALILLSDDADLDAVSQRVHEAGGRVVHVFPPSALIAETAGELPATIGVEAVHNDRVGRASMTELDEDARRAARTWNHLLAPSPSSQDNQLVGDSLGNFGGNAFEPPTPWVISMDPPSDDPTPGFRQTSEFFIGRVAVGIVMPQSDGSIDPSTEAWTGSLRDSVLAEITAALDWWAAREPRANLTFVYDDNGGEPVTTSYEPITRPYTDEYLWIAETMENKGYSGSTYFDRVYAYNNTLRETHDTDWAFTIFVVNSTEDPDDRFADGFFAYAYIGGPFCVVTTGVGGYGIQHLGAVVAHEVGHIFHALDQYEGAGGSCASQAGYLAVENQNKAGIDCLSDEPSIMRSLVEPFASGALDPYARGQVGWQDSAGNAILDPVNTTIVLTNTSYLTHPVHSNVFEFAGTVQQKPYPSATRASVTINTIDTVQYRIGDGEWVLAEPADGAFDTWQESFHFTTHPLPTGEHTVDIRAMDSWGNSLTDTLATVYAVNPADDTLVTTLTRVEGSGVQVVMESITYEAQAVSETSYIAATYYRVGSEEWQLLVPVDGGYGDPEESFVFDIALAPLPPGTYELQIYSIDGDGNIEQPPASDSFVVDADGYHVYLFMPLMLSPP